MHVVLQPYVSAMRAADDNYSLEQAAKSRTCEYAGDFFYQTECVHFITRDDRLQTLTLAFRGSRTTKDWMQDAQCVLSTIPNPVPHKIRNDNKRSCNSHASDAEASNNNNSSSSSNNKNDSIHGTLNVHQSFRHYLYGGLQREISMSCKDEERVDHKMVRSSLLLAPYKLVIPLPDTSLPYALPDPETVVIKAANVLSVPSIMGKTSNNKKRVAARIVLQRKTNKRVYRTP